MFSVSLLIYILLCLFGFMLMRFTFTPIIRKYSQTLEITPMMLPFGYVLMFYAVGAALIYFLLPSTDFVVPLTAVKVFLPIVLAGVIFISSMFFSQFMFSCFSKLQRKNGKPAVLSAVVLSYKTRTICSQSRMCFSSMALLS